MYVTADTTFIPNNAARTTLEAAAEKGHLLVAILCPAIKGRKAQVVIETGHGPVPCTVAIEEAPSSLEDRDLCNVNFHVEKRGEQFHIHGHSQFFFGND